MIKKNPDNRFHGKNMDLEKLKTISHRAVRSVIDAVYPHRCHGCNDFFHVRHPDHFHNIHPGHDRSAPILSSMFCSKCIDHVTPVSSPFCSKCGLMFKSRQGNSHLCGRCLTFDRKFGIARAFAVYDQAVKTAIHQLKYNSALAAARPFGKLLFVTFMKYWDPSDIQVIIPVPLHVQRFRQRGFNQAALLIRDWPKTASKLNYSIGSVRFDVLVRERLTEAQVGKNRKNRAKNIRGAFAVKNDSAIKNKRVLVVDDVFTTGATADECARVLIESGADRVDVLTLAQTPRLS